MRSPSIPRVFYLALMLVSSRALAQNASAVADSLYEEGKRLLDAKRYADACPKFAASLAIDPAGGTLLALASCHELEGKTASAWGEFGDAAATARKDGRTERETMAKQHIAALVPKLSRLTISVSPSTASIAGLDVRRDGARVTGGAWGVPIAVDPGTHVVEASAPGRRAWKTEVVIGPVSDAKSIEIPTLEESEALPPPTAPMSPAASSGSPLVAPAPETPTATDSKRVAGWIVGGVGVIAIGAGAAFGLSAISKANTVKRSCPGGVCPTQSDADVNDSGHTAAKLSDVAFALGIAAVGVGTVLVLTSNGGETATIQIGPKVAPTLAGLTAGGTW